MFAVFETGGKQYKVQQGDIIYVEKLNNNEGDKIVFDKVLMVDAKIGTPYVSGAKVSAKILKHGKQKKIHIIKFKSKKHHLKRMGHRQQYTKLEIDAISC